MAKRILAILFIYLCTVVAWFFLASTVMVRTTNQDGSLRRAVGQLWGSMQIQQAPKAWCETKRGVHPLALQSSRVDVSLALEHRRKGLLWYSTYKVDFDGTYVVANDTRDRQDVRFSFSFPARGAVYDNFQFMVGETQVENIDLSSGDVQHTLRLSPGESRTFRVSYRSQGLDQWWYDFGDNVNQVKDFHLTMNTDFDKIDFPQNSMSPTSRTQVNGGWKLEWQYANLLTGVRIGMDLPKKLNPGPWVSKVTFAAPISLFLFFFLLFVFTTLRNIRMHPMNYFFIGAAFFSFHLLLAYLVDHVSVHRAFAISAAASIALVVSYMRLVVSNRFAFVDIALAQLVYLVMFSYSFFFEGFTGLAITILCVVTLFIVMQATGRVDWEAGFRAKPPPR